VKPAMLDLSKVAAHYAINSVFEPDGSGGKLYAYDVEVEDARRFEAGAAKLLVGRVKITSDVTQECAPLTYGVLHFGDHHLNGAVRQFEGKESFETVAADISDAFYHADFAETVRRLDKHFSGTTYSLKSLFKDQQRRILNAILSNTLEQATANLRLIFESHAALMSFLKDVGMPQPRVLRSASRFVLSADVRDIVEKGLRDESRLVAILRDAKLWDLTLELDGVDLAAKNVITEQMQRVAGDPNNTGEMRQLARMVRVARMLPLELNVWRAQNLYHDLLDSMFPHQEANADAGDPQAQEWIDTFRELGDQLMVAVPR
jgi:hypothetical protein